MLIRIDEASWVGLRAHLLARHDVETAAVLFAEQIDGSPVLVVRSWARIPDEGYAIRRVDRLSLDAVVLNRLLRPARDRGVSVITVHSHPLADDAWFSHADDLGDARLLPSFARRTPDVPHGSMVIARRGAVIARLLHEGRLIDASVHVVGRTLARLTSSAPAGADARFARQVLALGEDGQRSLRTIRVGVVGLGGVGSIVAVQLGHLGVGEIVLVDGDLVEDTNVSRIVGVHRGDPDRTAKVEVARRYLDQAGLPSTVRVVSRFVRTRDDARALADCDVILSCVDKHTPRALLNRLAYEALIPTIDIGSGIRVDAGGAVTGAAGRVVVIGPGKPCLSCWGHIDPDALREEALSTDERADLAAEGYVRGAVVPEPSVIPFNGMVGSAAMIEMLRITTGFAGVEDPPGRLAFDFRGGTVRRNGLAARVPCTICGSSLAGGSIAAA